jgi:hypothetical protein
MEELLLDYMELAVSPEVTLNDEWYENFRATVRRTLFSVESTVAARAR